MTVREFLEMYVKPDAYVRLWKEKDDFDQVVLEAMRQRDLTEIECPYLDHSNVVGVADIYSPGFKNAINLIVSDLGK